MSKAKRKSLGKKQRFAIFQRDSFTCQYCGRSPPTVILELDHVIAVANGGGNESSNLVTACHDCNSGKSDTDLKTIIPSLKENLAKQIEEREQLEEYNTWLMAARKRERAEIDELGVYWMNDLLPACDVGRYTVGEAFRKTLFIFYKQMPVTEIYEAMDIASSRVQASRNNWLNRWKYFCGVCWKRIKSRQGASPNATN